MRIYIDVPNGDMISVGYADKYEISYGLLKIYRNIDEGTRRLIAAYSMQNILGFRVENE